MASSRGNCEIVEAKDDHPSTINRPQSVRQLRTHDREQKPPILKKPHNKSLEDDINKLFESVNLRACKSLDLSDSWRNASKKPMRAVGSHSPVTRFSDPISLKQALRGLCISQAAEVAALKRLSMPPSASPRMSEKLYRSVVVEGGESRTEVSGNSSRFVQDSTTNSSCSSPNYIVEPNVKPVECKSSDSGLSLVESSESVVVADKESSPACNVITHASEAKQNFEVSALPRQNSHGDDVISKPDKKISAPIKVPKLRRKSKIQTASSSSAVKSNRDSKPTRVASRTIKPVIRNKNIVIRKPKKVPESTDANNLKKSGQMICQKCQCSLTVTSKDSPATVTTTEASDECRTKKPDSIPIGWENKGTHVKTIENLKSTEKGDISQSSKSSICDFSSSTTTSLSEDSSLSGSTCGSKPHMSKDTRWGAINCVRKQYGFVGLNHFNLLKKLGSGDIGTVYLAELVGTNCPFAIKVMDNEFLGRRKKMPRAHTEREILRMLDHPFLPTLYAQFTSDNLSCLVMEFCPGGDLHVLRQKQLARCFPEQAARFYVAEVLLALEYLHMLGIVYRDLKPENILVREDGHIMLTDFDLSLRCTVNPMLVKSSSLGKWDPPRVSGPCAGSNCIDPFCNGPSCQVSCFAPSRAKKLKAEAAAKAKARSLPQLVAEPTEARSNSFVGTHEYLAPEIIKGEGHGSAVDWWTLGVFLYELLYGRTPFKGAENEETLANVVCRGLKFPEGPIVSFEARDLMRGLLVKEPENRLGVETGAAEIKRHPFFEGLNWALIRCAVPPQIPEVCDVVNSNVVSLEGKGEGFMECSVDGEHLEFELF
ncbi:hypothetical protein ABFX02_10G051800 [Erythranthe guttata]